MVSGTLARSWLRSLVGFACPEVGAIAGRLLPRALIVGIDLLIVGFSVTAAQGQPVRLATTSSWFPLTRGETWSVAWGDVDGDGDLDLACGNLGANAMFLNEGGRLGSDPVWMGRQESPEDPDGFEPTYSLAWGDVDGDGDLDLVCGNYERPNSLYLNEQGMLSTMPVWSSAISDSTVSVAWGDVDGDGDLDLVCGNYERPNSLYLNEQGMLSTMPVWSSAISDSTLSVAWGDADGDGDLDLACGNHMARDTLYLNEGGVLSSEPVWSSATSDWTFEVAWGDVDGDGDLDLACSSFGEQNKVYENVGGVLSSTAMWSSEIYPTRSLAWADVDRDGDLDLACGGYGAPITIYLNEQGTLSAAPVWSSEGFLTNALAFGDVDNDGDLDLVSGNFGENTLLLNEEGIFSPNADWVSEPGDQTSSVAWGDVDGDGRPDLVCANDFDPSRLYVNEGGQLSAAPSWSGEFFRRATSVALGDVDGDGDLDLACGGRSGSNHVYRNEGGTFSPVPRWLATEGTFTFGIAWGDVDGDGTLDLVCGNLNRPNTLYRGDGSLLSSAPSWSSQDSLTTYAVALGDVDGDGDLDLACGNSGQPNTLYRNDEGALTVVPAWASALSEPTRAVAWGDVDADGDLDLACGNLDAPNTVYLNEAGTLSSTPTWFSSRTQSTYSLAWGDADGDGDLDLVCGNTDGNLLYLSDQGTLSRLASDAVLFGAARSLAWADMDGDGDLDLANGVRGPNTLHRGRMHPVYRWDAQNPTHHLPNNGTQLRDIRVQPLGENRLLVTFRIVDVESDPVRIRADYSFGGGSDWRPLDLQGVAGASVGPLESSPSGHAAGFAWDISNLPFETRNAVLRLRVVELPGHGGTVQFAASYAHDAGRVMPLRPQVEVPGNVVFPAVSLGDTSTVDLQLSNTGTLPLEIQNVLLPSLEMDVSIPPAVLAPGENTLLSVTLRPRDSLDPGAEILVATNDPLRPVVSVPLSADVRDLTFAARLLGSAPPVPLGEVVPVSLRPDPGVRVERAAVHLRARGTGAAFTRIELESLDDEFFGILPAASVTELGLEYYVEVENSGILRFDPPSAPATFHTLDVEGPGSVTTQVQPNLGSSVVVDRDVSILVLLPPGSRFAEGMVFYRPGATAVYDSVAIEDAAIPRATVEATALTERGLEYWTRVRTVSGAELTDPPVVPSTVPHVLTLTVRELAEPSEHPGRRYRLVSVPLRFPEEFEGTFEDLVREEREFGPYDPLRWRLFRFHDGANVELTEDPSLFRPSPGTAYWLISADRHQIDTAPHSALSLSSRDRAAIVLQPGWNAIANPFAFAVAWGSVEHGENVRDLTAFEPLRGGRGDYSPDPVEVLQPFEGYFVHNGATTADTLWVPPVEASTRLRERVATKEAQPGNTSGAGWRLTLTARAEGSAAQTVVGVHALGREGIDVLDRRRPPDAPAAGVRLTSSSPERPDDPLWIDVRSDHTEGHRWDLVLRSSAMGEEIDVGLAREDVPRGHVARLVDVEQGVVVDLGEKEGEGHRLLSYGPRDYRLALLVGTPAFVEREVESARSIPPQLVLDRNAPNPFNPSTRIRFGLPRSGPVTLAIYNVRGEKIVELLDGERLEAGFHTSLWKGQDHRGRAAASGIYICRLTTEYGTTTRKMVLTR